MARQPSSSSSRHPRSRGHVPGTEVMFELARRVTQTTGCPVVGGIAVSLHGFDRMTRDIDIYVADLDETHATLVDAGIQWNPRRREHSIDGVAVHLVPQDVFGVPPQRTSTIKGVKVIGLPDLVRSKLSSGLEHVTRAQDIADVIGLIECIPLDKSFAARLPTRLRAPFKVLVEQVHGPRRTTVPTLQFWKKYA